MPWAKGRCFIPPRLGTPGPSSFSSVSGSSFHESARAHTPTLRHQPHSILVFAQANPHPQDFFQAIGYLLSYSYEARALPSLASSHVLLGPTRYDGLGCGPVSRDPGVGLRHPQSYIFTVRQDTPVARHGAFILFWARKLEGACRCADHQGKAHSVILTTPNLAAGPLSLAQSSIIGGCTSWCLGEDLVGSISTGGRQGRPARAVPTPSCQSIG